MNILKFIESFGDERTLQNVGSRRESFSQLGNIGKNVALASIPFGLSALSNKSFAADISPTPSTPIGALQLALTLEYLEREFYQTALDTIGLIPPLENGGRDLKVFQQISQHENDHVDFLIAGLGGTGSANFVMKPTFDFTAGGTFSDVFSNYQTFLALAQAFEDTGVRAYKGQAANLIGDDALLTAALQIHSVEARHASEVRRLRMQKGWITGNTSAPAPAAQAVYNGEENTVQAGFNTATVNNGTNGPAISALAGSEAFDEPLTTMETVAIANLFIV
ncbi:MAG: ferritin-like domain-containing protein [Flavobacterium sp.]|nr:MAG: ferritin-like domain-containing protein [Flavobacterium sp.]